MRIHSIAVTGFRAKGQQHITHQLAQFHAPEVPQLSACAGSGTNGSISFSAAAKDFSALTRYSLARQSKCLIPHQLSA